MNSLWYRVLIAPRSEGEDARRREYILNIILLASILMLLFCDAIVGYYGLQNHPSGTPFLAFSILPAFFIVLYALSRRGFFVLSSYLLIAAYFIGNSYAAYHWGINLPTGILGYALLIVIGSILISTRFAFVLTGIIGIYVAALWYIQLHEFIVVTPQSLTLGDGIALVVLYFIIVIVAWLSNREIERSLARARISERELKEERDLLEVKVDERTHELQAAQLEKVDRLYRFAEFGQLASGLFHDLTSMLNAIALRIEHDTPPELTNAFTVQREIDDFVESVRKQLNQETTQEYFSMVEGTEWAMQLLVHKCHTEHISLSFIHDASIPDYFGDAAKFHQVMVNVLMNAVDSFIDVAYSPGAVRTISIKLFVEHNEVIIQVKDTGSGMPIEIQQKIFEPFFTTKGGKGTGIGLAITRRIVENYFFGIITVESFEGQGSLFTIRFPLLTHEKFSSNL
jgi:signal transduction histidine kinase